LAAARSIKDAHRKRKPTSVWRKASTDWVSATAIGFESYRTNRLATAATPSARTELAVSPLYARAKIATEVKSTAVAAGMNQLEEGS
jgi:hypothetical protein